MAPSSRSNKTRKAEVGKEVVKIHKVVKHTEAECKPPIEPPIVVTPSRPKINSKVKPTVQNNMLASFGIVPAQRKKFSSGRDTKLKCCVVETPVGNSIIFRFEPINKNLSSWSEKLMSDEIKAASSWIEEMNFDHICYNWFDKLVQQSNNKGYAIRLFTINIDSAAPSYEVLLKIGRVICDKINNLPENKTVALVDKNDFIWIEHPTWADIIGVDAATRRLKETIGPFHNELYVEHSEIVHSYFKQDQLPQYLARLIGAPVEKIILDINDESENNDDKSDSDSDECIDLKKPTLI